VARKDRRQSFPGYREPDGADGARPGLGPPNLPGPKPLEGRRLRQAASAFCSVCRWAGVNVGRVYGRPVPGLCPFGLPKRPKSLTPWAFMQERNFWNWAEFGPWKVRLRAGKEPAETFTTELPQPVAPRMTKTATTARVAGVEVSLTSRRVVGLSNS
jgi:hypothetical protein